ncbi:MAG: RIP metalloprotease RseP [Lachnospiraceae bacterium]|nr:RIP metalloprotease RseP [Lachnospiraceae bacterium]
MQLILFIIILAVLVLVHEGGHFVIGKKSGIGVDEFNIGFGPVIFRRVHNGTKYSLRLLPFGGSCVFEGFDGEESDSPTSFINSPVWARFSTVAAGPFMNFVLAFFLSLFVIGSAGYDAPVLSGTIEGFPAEEAGLEAGDEIYSVNGKKVVLYRDISMYLLFHEGETVRVRYKRDGLFYDTVITPKYDAEDGRFYLGILGGMREKGNALQTMRYSVSEVRYWIEMTVNSIINIFKGRVSKDDLAGPVGVAKVVGDVYEESKPEGLFVVWLNMLQLTILLSADLGVMNLLPFPALDGGRLVFIIIEAVTGKGVDKRIEAGFHFFGMCCLLLLMMFVMYNDISKIFAR